MFLNLLFAACLVLSGCAFLVEPLDTGSSAWLDKAKRS